MNKMMNDPRMKKLLQDLINRPESVSSMDVQPEDMGDAEQMKVESPDQEYEMPEDIKHAIPEMGGVGGAEVAPEDTKDAESMKVQSPAEQFQGDPAITAALRKLKAGQPVADEADVTPETIDDTSMDSDLRKAALMKVKQKYLGR